MEVPKSEQVRPTEEFVNQALQHRAELVESRIQLNSQEVSNKALHSALLPHPGRLRVLRRLWAGRLPEPYKLVR